MDIKKIENTLGQHSNKTITEEDLRKIFRLESYSDFYHFAKMLIESRVLEGKGKLNRMPEPMYHRFRILSKYKTYINHDYLDLLYPKFDVSFYKVRKNINVLEKHYPYIKKLSDYLNKCLASKDNPLVYEMAINERSFEIWKDEKFLESDEGKALLKNIKFSMGELNVFKSREPFFDFYQEIRNTVQILIVENKDTWYSLRKTMKYTGELMLFGKNFNVIVYGEGKKILRSLEYLEERPYKEYVESIYYIGDLDYEGISILNLLKDKYPQYNISPFLEMYNFMIQKSKGIDLSRVSGKKQTKYKIDDFLHHIEEREYIENILAQGCYIAQEIVNYRDMQLLNEKGV
ncbi:MAG: Wadjet anti-phage system protein JetD domain-containing protein [Bacillota bacterium]